jgi:hypothetical protein
LAAEAKFQTSEHNRQQRIARELDRQQRATLPEGWSELNEIAYRVYRADGKSDHAALIAELSRAIVAVEFGFAAQTH